MCDCRKVWASVIPGLLMLGACAPMGRAQTPLRTINNPQGGKIVYGLVDGATSTAAAMSMVLRGVHQSCGDKPQVGRLFRVRGTDSVAAFFTVVNHPQGNKPVAGLVIAAPAGSQKVEAALVSDDAPRFGSTVNPMLNRLFREWHPGGGGAPGASAAGSARAAPLHQVVAQDRSLSVGIPDGWKINASYGTALINGPQGESVILDAAAVAIDSQAARYARPGNIVFSHNADLVQGFPNLFQQFWQANGKSIDFRVDHIEPASSSQGTRCVHATGRQVVGAHLPEKDMFHMDALLCVGPMGTMGHYMVMLSEGVLSPALADKENATVAAIFSSFQLNQAVVAQEAHAMAAPAVNAIHQIGAMAAARTQATQAANDAQHAGYWARQDANARSNQAFSNYLLNQTVIQNNNVYGNGTVGHATVWNSTADALVKADPNRYEIVNSPNFWKGWDY